MNKKILILHTSIGLGHKFIAENIGFQLSEAGFEVRLADVLKVQEGKLVKISTLLHAWMNTKAPWLWSFLYHFTNLAWVNNLTLPIRFWVASKNSQQTLELVKGFQPDMVISVQNTASGIVAYLKKKQLYTGLFGIGFSDFHLHKFWLYPGADFYLVNIDEQKQEMVSFGISKEKIFVCGIALKPKIAVNTEEVRTRLGIKPGEKVILLGSGSLGIGFNKELLGRLLELDNVKVVVVCGKNEEYKKYLEKKYLGKNILPLGFYRPMSELYSIADIFLSKPGGLTTAETLQAGLPMFVTHVLPGQEELNLTYLQGKGLIKKVSGNILEEISKEMASGEAKKALAKNPNVSPVINPQMSVKTAVLQCFTRV